LGDLLSRGLGAPHDLVGAYVWLSLAAEQGRRWPARRREEIAQDMTAEQRAQAEARLEAWRESR
ncbi:MAG: SEL1-like repeat protein, partial [Kiloniellales bacterium]